MSTGRLWLAATLLAAGATLAACGGAAVGPTPPPSNTSTPVSTPLATLAPTAAAGAEDNPIQLFIVNEGGGRAVDNAASDLAASLSDATGLSVQVSVVDSDRAAVAVLCAAFDGPPALAFVSAPGYSAAAALGCGFPLLLAQDRESDVLAREVILIASEDSAIGVLADVNDKTFCRLSAADLVTWQAPALLMLANGIAPTSALREVVDVPDIDTLVEQVAAGECDVAALYADDFARIADADMQANITRLAQSVNLPLGVLMTAQEVPLGAREALKEALREYARTNVGAVALSALLGVSGLALPASDSLTDWDTFVDNTRLDFAGFDS
ncbi:MAG TPA: PhnD/SsuA/transferrin family substrate-binding protein [Candidatus Limnocylindrales bacterium]|nr:PhnD/SsuA/transferrin family substrate-binding protein [Candidatus Limnocylindrales bacterium]